MSKHAEFLKQKKENLPIEVSIIDKKNPSSKPTQMAPALPKSLPKNLEPALPKYFSDKDQYVQKQTHAKNLQLYNPISPSIMGSDLNAKDQKPSDQGNKPDEQKSQDDSKNNSDDGVTFKKSTQGGRKSEAAVASDPLLYEDADVGSITALNAQGVQFYAFTSRIQGSIVNHWVSNLHFYESRLTRSDVDKLAGNSWTTVVDVILDSEGHLKNIIIGRSSGIREVDDAVTNTFKQISYFPNPPREMVEADHTVHLQYAFRLDVTSARQMAAPKF